MIARVWSGRTPLSKSDAFLRYLKETGVADIRATPGNRGTFVLRRLLGDRAEFVVLSLWDSMEAVHRFSGRDDEGPRYYPRDREYLMDLRPDATHYDVMVWEGLPG